MNKQLESKKVLTALKLKKLPKFDSFKEVGEYVTKHLYIKHDVESDFINNGHCFVWLFLVWSLWEKSEEFQIVTTDGHVFFKHKGKYFDSDHLRGTKVIEDIAFATDEDVTPVTIDQMLWFWTQCALHKDVLRDYARKIIPNTYKRIKLLWNTASGDDAKIYQIYSTVKS